MKVSIVLPTLNEEQNLPGALESVKEWAHEVFVVDSLSSDGTVDIAIECGVSIVQRPFVNYGDQWCWSLKHLPIKSPWILKLDADERVPPELVRELHDRFKQDPSCDGFVARIDLWFMGKPLHTCIKTCRLWRKSKGRFSDVAVNEHLLVDGVVGVLKNPIKHVDSPDMEQWRKKQERYVAMEAIMRVKNEELSAGPKLFGSALERRMFLKKVFFKIPFRYQLLWLHEVIVRGAWRAGKIGLRWAGLRVGVYRSIEAKVHEILVTGNVPEVTGGQTGGYDARVLESSLQKDVSRESRAVENNRDGRPAVGYFGRFAGDWDQRYERSPLFKMRYRAFERVIPEVVDQETMALDYGCGSGILTELLAKAAESVVAVDPSAEMRKVASNRLSVYPNVEITDAAPDRGGAFDVIICSSVIEYIENDADFLRDMASRLKVGGVLIITFPNRFGILQVLNSKLVSKIRKNMYSAYQLRRYTRRSIHKLLAESELSVLRLYSPVGLPLAGRLGLGELFFCVAMRGDQ